MKIDRKGLKAQAKQAIRAAAPVFWLVTLVYLLLTEGLSTVVGWRTCFGAELWDGSACLSPSC